MEAIGTSQQEQQGFHPEQVQPLHSPTLTHHPGDQEQYLEESVQAFIPSLLRSPHVCT